MINQVSYVYKLRRQNCSTSNAQIPQTVYVTSRFAASFVDLRLSILALCTCVFLINHNLYIDEK